MTFITYLLLLAGKLSFPFPHDGRTRSSLLPRRVHANKPSTNNVTQGPQASQAAKADRPERGGAQMSRLITRLSFCTRLSRKSPCLIVARYCALLASGRVLLTTPATC